MRKLFPEYYKPTEEEFNNFWENCIFSFDTNILLNVYRYTPKTRERFFEIIDKLQERIWLPYNVAFEYQRERLEVISEQLKPYSKLENLLKDNFDKTKKEISTYNINYPFFHESVETNQILEKIEKAYKEIEKQVKENLSDSKLICHNLLNEDIFHEKLTNLFDNRVGEAFFDEELEKIYKEAEKRFQYKYPPGYKDESEKKKPDCYGDVVIWFQLINYARDQKKPLIFITNDQKEDWWMKRSGKKISPRPELIKEMFAKAGVSFYMYTGENFLKKAGEFLNLNPEPEVIKEARKIGNQNNEIEKKLSTREENLDDYKAIVENESSEFSKPDFSSASVAIALSSFVLTKALEKMERDFNKHFLSNSWRILKRKQGQEEKDTSNDYSDDV